MFIRTKAASLLQNITGLINISYLYLKHLVKVCILIKTEKKFDYVVCRMRFITFVTVDLHLQ
jgi:hypothetical protein